jgi:hypothetical protein
VCCTAARRRSKMNTPAQHPSGPTPRFQHPNLPVLLLPPRPAAPPRPGRGARVRVACAPAASGERAIRERSAGARWARAYFKHIHISQTHTRGHGTDATRQRTAHDLRCPVACLYTGHGLSMENCAAPPTKYRAHTIAPTQQPRLRACLPRASCHGLGEGEGAECGVRCGGYRG